MTPPIEPNSVSDRLHEIRRALRRRDYATAEALAAEIHTGDEPAKSGPVGERLRAILQDRDHDAGTGPADQSSRRRSAP